MLFFLLFFIGLAHYAKNQAYGTSVRYDEIYGVLFIISLFILLCYQLQLFLKKRKLIDAIRYDRLMLEELLGLVDIHREEVEQGMGIVGKEILKMRLKRIKF